MDKVKVSSFFKEMKPSPMLQMFEAAGKYNDIINLGIGEPDFDTDISIIDAAHMAAKNGFTHYPPVSGFPDLRQEIVKYWHDKYGLDSTVDEVMVTVGASQAIYLTLQSIIDHGDEVIVPDPCFTSYLQAVNYLYGKPVSVPVYEENGFNLTAENIEKHLTEKTKILILNSPNNPTGAVMDRAEMEKIAELVEKHNLIVISDEVYESFLFEGEHVCFAALPGMKERTFTVAGFSKTYAMTGWRIGYVIGPQKSINIMKIIGVAETMGVSAMTQKASVFAMQNCEQKVAEMINVYKERVNFTYDRINSIPSISCIRPKGAFYVFMNIKGTGMTSLDFSWKMLDDAHVIVIPGISFGANGEGYVRIACTVPVEKMDLAFKRMENALK